MNIYDEEIKDIEEVIHLEGTCSIFTRIRKSLIYAKKEHELLGLYQLRDNYQSHTSEYQKIQKGIKALEKELEELK